MIFNLDDFTTTNKKYLNSIKNEVTSGDKNVWFFSSFNFSGLFHGSLTKSNVKYGNGKTFPKISFDPLSHGFQSDVEIGGIHYSIARNITIWGNIPCSIYKLSSEEATLTKSTLENEMFTGDYLVFLNKFAASLHENIIYLTATPDFIVEASIFFKKRSQCLLNLKLTISNTKIEIKCFIYV